MVKIAPSLWFIEKAAEAAAFYVSLFPDARIDRVTTLPAESPSGPAESVEVVEFTLAGQPFTAMAAGPLDPFNHAISFTVKCETQAEVDHYWTGLLDGGTAEQCGWLRDRYGIAWQIVPSVMFDMMADPDRARAARASQAMFGMVKFDIAELRRATDG